MTGYRAVIASMSEQDGIIYIRTQEKPVESSDFIDYLKKLKRKMGNTPLALFVD